MKRFILLLIAASLAMGFALNGKLQAMDPNFPPLIYDSNGEPICTGGIHVCTGFNAAIPSFMTDDLGLAQVGTLVAPMYNSMAGGDSDEDGFFEAYMYIKDNIGGWTYTYRIYESDGNHNYTQAFQAAEGLIPYAFGDTDGDGLPEVIGQWSSWIYVFESPQPGRLATNLVWQSPAVVNVTGYTTIGDLDQDGSWEIIHTQNSFGADNRLIVWENTGNNQYQEVYNQQVSNSNLGTKAIADFDGDGAMEIAFTSGSGDVYVFESTGNDNLQLVYHGNMNTANAYACVLTNDMDGNGRPEFACEGSNSNLGWVTQIYEAVDDNQYQIRQEIAIYDGYFGVPGLAAGDFDGDGVDELVIQCAQSIHVYKWNGLQWSEEESVPENFGSILHGVFAYDGDDNGYDEVFWLGIGDGGYWTNETIILETEYLGFQPDISVTLTPATTPIVIPASGGSFDYSLEITNNEADEWNFDVRLLAVLPDSTEYITNQLDNFTLAGGSSIIRQRVQIVPAPAPPGDYIFRMQVGNLPNVIWDSDEFPFTKEP